MFKWALFYLAISKHLNVKSLLNHMAAFPFSKKIILFKQRVLMISLLLK